MKLVTQSGPLTGQELPIDKPVIVLGRGMGGDVILEDQEASRRHAEIRFSGREVSITDLGSRNGTFVNGARIQDAQVLRPGDEIRIGASRFWLQEGVALATAPAAAAVPGGGLAELPPAREVSGGGSSLGLILGGLAVVGVLLIAAVVAFLILSRGGAAPRGSGVSAPPVQATTVAGQGTPAPTQGAPAPSDALTTPLVQPFVTFTPKPEAPTVAVSPASGGPAGQPGTPASQLPFTVKWSPGRYEGWAEGKRMSSDLTIQNTELPEIKPPYTPYFILSDPKGNMRQAELRDYGEGKGPPTIAKGQTLTWTWFGIMDKNEWVRGSVFRYAGYAWAQEFNPDGSLAGPPRVIDEKQLIPFLPKEIPPEMIPTIAATIAATMAAGGMPTGIPTGIPTAKP
jgi:hypothetical protein